ncbi:hypothetical protein BCON_0225g00180 [Botryotinia convoluta]|uniref:Uncharacterized protein n=1 Tax=Botryotinia convoluta TaxID=54673 RepID=A0A4Z1HNT7_9HELO|nr:hypothetical protein BCON_0225g00180 [Botryotinia convoluta]
MAHDIPKMRATTTLKKNKGNVSGKRDTLESIVDKYGSDRSSGGGSADDRSKSGNSKKPEPSAPRKGSRESSRDRLFLVERESPRSSASRTTQPVTPERRASLPKSVINALKISRHHPQNAKSPPKNTTSPPIATGDIFSPALMKLVPVANPPESFKTAGRKDKV